MNEIVIGIKVKKHDMDNWALLLMVRDDNVLGSVAVQLIDGKLEEVDSTMTVTKHLGGADYFVFTGAQFNAVVGKFNAGEIKFDEVVEL